MTNDPSEPDPESRVQEQEEYERQREARYRQRSLIDLRDRLAANLFRDLFNAYLINGTGVTEAALAVHSVDLAEALVTELRKR